MYKILHKNIAFFLLLAACTSKIDPNSNTNSQNSNSNSAQNASYDSFEKTKIIPRGIFFDDKEIHSVSLCPNGKNLQFFKKDQFGKALFCISDLNGKIQKSIKLINECHGFTDYSSKRVLFLNDNGDENTHIFRVNLKNDEIKNLTPFPGVKAMIIRFSRKHVDQAVIGMNKDDPKWFDIYKLNLKTGKLDLILKNREFSPQVICDEDFNIKFLHKVNLDASCDIFYVNGDKKELFEHIPPQDSGTTYIDSLSKDGKYIYKIDSIGRDKSVFVKQNIQTKEKQVLFSNDKADISHVSYNTYTFEPEFVEVNYLKSELHAIDPKMKPHLDHIKSVVGKDKCISITGHEKNFITFSTYSDVLRGKLFLYDTKTKEVRSLFNKKRKIDNYKFSKTDPIVIKSRDGLDLVCYLTKAYNYKSGTPSALILMPHGGPWARDYWGFNFISQFFANRGYSVLQVNYRGSTGFGKNFINAANGNVEKMHDDLIDAVNWAIQNKIADKNKIAVFGGSFGGYATLRCLTQNPELFKCGIDMCGFSNWITFINTIPKYWTPFLSSLYWLIGDINTPKGRKNATLNSPITHIKNIKSPLLILQGKNDPRVVPQESLQMYNAIKDKVNASYILYVNEGHGVSSDNNFRSFIAFMERFLHDNLGGRLMEIEPMDVLTNEYKVVGGGKYLGVQY